VIELQVALLLVVAVLAVGCGVSVGWILHARYVRANPTGTEAVAKMAAQQVAQIERNCAARIEKVEEAYSGNLAILQQSLGQALYALRKPGADAGPPAAIPPLSDADSVAHAMGDPVSDRAALRAALIARDVDPATADAVLDHKYDDIPAGTVLSEMADRIIAESTRIQ
jgi:hypothetical protein